MKHLSLHVVGASILLVSSPGQAGTCRTDDPRLDDRMMVRLLPGIEVESFAAALESDFPEVGVTPLDSIPGRDIWLLGLQLPPSLPGDRLDEMEDALGSNYEAYLEWGDFLYTNAAPEGTTGSTLVDHPANASIFANQYARTHTGADDAQTRSVGTGVVVAVLDTGVDANHPELAGRILPGFDFIDGDTDPADLGDGVDTDGDGLTDEMTGHGTFVAGLVSLIAPAAKILPVRVLDGDGNGDLWLLAKGMFYAIDRGVEVINISISSTYKGEATQDAVLEAANLGIIVVAAAGNCNTDDPPEYPAMRDHFLAVGASDDGDLKGGFSNYGEDMSLMAPGVSALIGSEPDPARSIISLLPAGGYAYWEGTSMATPVVAGAAALVRAQHPEWPADETTRAMIEAALESTAVNIDALNPPYAGLLGAGRIDIAAAAALGPPEPAVGDLNNDGAVDALDLVILLLAWGQTHSSADLNGDGIVNVLDLVILILAL